MLDLFEKSLSMQKDKIPFIINIIIKKEGSSPRECGAWMIVDKNGLKEGTIGGGALEFAAIEKSKELLKTKTSTIENYTLNEKEAINMGMVCGGKNTILFLYVDPENTEINEIMEYAVSNYEKNKIEVFFDTNAVGINLYVDGELKKSLDKCNTAPGEFIKFLITGRQRALIFGGGHIAQSLAPILNNLNFDTVVVEDREEFLEIEPFSNSKRILSRDYSIEELDISIHDYVVILTRGHQYDRQILFSVLNKKPKYIGIIGSKRKAKILFDEIESSSYKDSKDIIHTPIGIDIKGETPYEIAISIASEIILDYRSNDESN